MKWPGPAQKFQKCLKVQSQGQTKGILPRTSYKSAFERRNEDIAAGPQVLLKQPLAIEKISHDACFDVPAEA